MRAVGGALGGAIALAGCSSFSATPAAVADAGADATTLTTEAGPNGDDFLVPLGSAGCPSIPTVQFCDDFEGANDQSNWATNVNAGKAQIVSDPNAPSPTHYAEVLLSDAEAGAANPCPYTRLYTEQAGQDFGQIAIQFAIKLGPATGSDIAQSPTQFGLLGFGDATTGETLYFGITQTQLLIHEQWRSGADNIDAQHPFPANVSHTDWIYLRLSVDLAAKKATLSVKGIPQSLVFTLGATTLGPRGNGFAYAIGYSCSARGGDTSFDDIVLTYE